MLSYCDKILGSVATIEECHEIETDIFSDIVNVYSEIYVIDTDFKALNINFERI